MHWTWNILFCLEYMPYVEMQTRLDFVFFFFQAEDGIRDADVTGVQTCALPIWTGRSHDRIHLLERLQKVRTLLTRDFEEAFKKVDAIVTPTSPTAAFKLGEKVDDPLAMYLADIYTVTADLAGIPGISVPCGETKENLPIGRQILGKHFDEATILRVAHAYEISRRKSEVRSQREDE